MARNVDLDNSKSLDVSIINEISNNVPQINTLNKVQYNTMNDSLPTPLEVYNEINAAIETKNQALIKYNRQYREFEEAKQLLQNEQNGILVEYSDLTKYPEGVKTLGSNDTARNAKIDSMTKNQKQYVLQKQYEFEITQQELRIAENNLDKWKYALRIVELAQRINE